MVIGDTTPEPDETFQVVLTGITNATPTTVTGTGTILNDDLCGAPASLISTIQGTGSASGMVGSSVNIEGIVVGAFQGSSKLNGFFVQEEDSDADANPLTSEGIFVFDGGFGVPVNPGDKVHVRGKVAEFSNLTEINNVTKVAVCSSGNTVSPATIHLPFDQRRGL
jgi:predicted extracellular nuclease